MGRPDGRDELDLRAVALKMGVSRHAEGSCLLTLGGTEVIATVTAEDRVPPFLRGQGQGWVHAEYAMLPRATKERTPREAVRGRQQGRSMEIQRLIGRALRAAVHLDRLGEKSYIVDVDVLQADGGTRCAGLTAGFAALVMALAAEPARSRPPLRDWLAAVSVGLMDGAVRLDLNYDEDSQIGVDMNVVMTGSHRLVEVQGSAEHGWFDRDQLGDLLDAAELGIDQLVAAQKAALPKGGALIGD